MGWRVPAGAKVYDCNREKISPEDLAAGIYPEGDIRNKPSVQRWMREGLAAEKKYAANPPKIETFNQRLERRFWNLLADKLEGRLSTKTDELERLLGEGTLIALTDALTAVKNDLQRRIP